MVAQYYIGCRHGRRRDPVDILTKLRNILRTTGAGMPTIETNTRKVIARLKADGWIEVDGGKHDKFEHPGRSEAMIVPRHKELSLGVARSIAKLAGWI